MSIAPIKSRLAELGITLYPHQKFGIKWMMYHEDNNNGGILADDPGLGKTLQIASLIYMNLSQSHKPTLIIVPTSIIFQWKQLLDNIFGASSVYLHYGDMRLNTIKALHIRNFHICITTPATLLLSKHTLCRLDWYRIVLDEAHIIKNHNTQLFNTITSISSHIRWAITGTPIQNSINDIKYIFTYIFNRTISKSEIENLISNSLLRRDKSILQLPTITIKDKLIKLDQQQHQDYISYITTIINDFRRKIRHLPSKYHIIWAFIVLMRIRIFTLKYKLHYLINHITTKSIVFYHYKSEFHTIRKLLLDKGFTVDAISGDVPIKHRDFIINVSKPDVLCVQIKAGGVGLNLQHYTKAFITSPDWNPANEIQAIARIHRAGQTHTTSYTRLILQTTTPTPDTSILSSSSPKSLLISQLLNTSPPSHTHTHTHTHTTHSLIPILYSLL